MNWSDFFNNLPFIGWVAVIMLIGVIGFGLFLAYKLFKIKNVKLKNIELTERVQKEYYHTEGKNLLDNQTKAQEA